MVAPESDVTERPGNPSKFITATVPGTLALFSRTLCWEPGVVPAGVGPTVVTGRIARLTEAVGAENVIHDLHAALIRTGA